MKKIPTLLILLACLAHDASAQPSILWQRSYGGSEYDDAYSVQPTADGGYVVAGASNVTGNFGAAEMWVVKLHSDGSLDWQQSYGGSGYEQARSIQQTSDGGYIMAGYSQSTDGDVTGNHGGNDAWVVKLDAAGGIDWQRSLGGSGDDGAAAVLQAADGGYVISGYTNSTGGDVTDSHGEYEMWVVKLSSDGTIIEWAKCLGGSWDEIGRAIQQTSDGGYIVAGHSRSVDMDVTGNHGSWDVWVVKLDADGVIDWQRSSGGSAEENGFSVQQTTDGGYVVAGFSESTSGEVTGNHGFRDVWVLKLTGAGAFDWQVSLGGTGGDEARSIQQTTDGGYVVAGLTESMDGDVVGNHGQTDYWVVKLDGAGALDWQKCLGGTGYDAGQSIRQVSDEGYIVAGFAGWADGDVTELFGSEDYWIVRLDPIIDAVPAAKEQIGFTIHPNPADASLTIINRLPLHGTASLSIVNAAGQEVYASRSSSPSLVIRTASLPDGVYFCRLVANEEVITQRLVVQH